MRTKGRLGTTPVGVAALAAVAPHAGLAALAALAARAALGVRTVAAQATRRGGGAPHDGRPRGGARCDSRAQRNVRAIGVSRAALAPAASRAFTRRGG
jgi:hypothetical protein